MQQKHQKARAGNARVVLYGKHGDVIKRENRVSLYAKNLGAQSTHILIPPSIPESEHSRKIVTEFQQPFTWCEGGITTTAGQALAIVSRDCPILVLSYQTKLAVVHVGRMSVQPKPMCESGPDVVRSALHKLNVTQPEQVYGYITGGISHTWFNAHDETLLNSFYSSFGPEAIPDWPNGCIDMAAVIRAILSQSGVPLQNITNDKLCTYETAWLGSKRAQDAGVPNKEEQNLVIAWIPSSNATDT